MSTETEHRDRLYTEYSELSEGTTETHQEGSSEYIERLTQAKRSYRLSPLWRGVSLCLLLLSISGFGFIQASPFFLQSTILRKFSIQAEQFEWQNEFIGESVLTMLSTILVGLLASFRGIRVALLLVSICLGLSHFIMIAGIVLAWKGPTIVASVIVSWLSQINVFLCLPLAAIKWIDRKNLGRDIGIMFAFYGITRLMVLKIWDYINHGTYPSFDVIAWLLLIPTIVACVSVCAWTILDYQSDTMEANTANGMLRRQPTKRILRQIDKLSVISAMVNSLILACVSVFIRWTFTYMNSSSSSRVELIWDYSLIMFISQAAGSLFCGYFNDNMGHRGHTTLFGAVCALIGFVIIIATFNTMGMYNLLSFTLINIAEGVALTSVYPSMCLINPQSVYGFMFSLQLFSKSILGCVSGLTYYVAGGEEDVDFRKYELGAEVVLFSIVACVLASLLVLMDKQHKLRRTYNF